MSIDAIRTYIQTEILGDPSALVSHLLREGDIDGDELDALRKRIDHSRGTDGTTDAGGSQNRDGDDASRDGGAS